MIAALYIVGFIALVAACWWFAGRAMAPVAIGTGSCRQCGRLAPLYGHGRCWRCQSSIEAML